MENGHPARTPSLVLRVSVSEGKEQGRGRPGAQTHLVRVLHVDAEAQLLENPSLCLYDLVLQVNVLLIQQQRRRFPAKTPCSRECGKSFGDPHPGRTHHKQPKTGTESSCPSTTRSSYDSGAGSSAAAAQGSPMRTNAADGAAGFAPPLRSRAAPLRTSTRVRRPSQQPRGLPELGAPGAQALFRPHV